MVDARHVRRAAGVIAAVLTAACTNMPPIVSRQPNGAVDLSLPLAPLLTDALLYTEDARIPLANGQVVVLEHDHVQGGARFLFPGGRFVQMRALRHARLVSSAVLPDGRTVAIVQGDLGAQPKVELAVVLQPDRAAWVVLGPPGQTWRMLPSATDPGRVVFEQQTTGDPLVRVFDVGSSRISSPFLRAMRPAAQAQRRAQAARSRPGPDEAQPVPVSPDLIDRTAGPEARAAAATPRHAAHSVGVQARLIVLNGATEGVRSAVAGGHQNIAPQEVNLR